MSPGPAPLRFTTAPITGPGLPTENDAAFRLALDQAVAGGTGTSGYLQHLLKLADFAGYLQKNGESALATGPGPGGGLQATATDGTTTLIVGLTLEQPAGGADPPVRGVATVRLALPHPYEIVKIAQFAVTLAELPAGFVLTGEVYQALLAPLVSQLTSFVRTALASWLDTDIGADLDGLTDALDGATAEAADAVAEETAEVVVAEEVVAEVAIDLAAAVPALAGLAVLMAVPLLLSALAKQFVLHIEVDNLTDVDFGWSVPYLDSGAVTVQPAGSVLPATGTATDSWGDRTTVPVVFQASFAGVNTSGYAGIGLVLALRPTGYPGQDTCAVIAIPWLADNVVWLGDPGSNPDWAGIYATGSAGTGALRVEHGNQRFVTTLAIDALSGQHDEYHCVLRIQRL